jgi:CSLREA domain-containing protein
MALRAAEAMTPPHITWALSIPVFVALVIVIGDAHRALGASLTVNATHDAVDAAPGDGVCDDGGGACTLRAAVMEANALPGADEIGVSPGTYTLSLAGAGENAAATGDLDITGDLTITGEGAASVVVDAAGIDRVFHLTEGAGVVSISGIAITGGNLEPQFNPTSLCFPLHHGGGGICITSGQLNLSEAEVRGNHSDDHGGGIIIGFLGRLAAASTKFHQNSSSRSGGAISNFGIATVSDSSISGNSAPAGGGVRNSGEIPGVNGLVTIERTTIEGNEGSIGGGIDNGFGGHMSVEGSTIERNDAVTGGGIYNSGGVPDLQADHSEMTLRDSTVRGNSATFGAGIYNAGNDTPGIATIAGTTIADNVSSRWGGGMYNTGFLDLTATTISGNIAELGGGGLLNAGTEVIPAGYRAQASLTNITISGNNGGQMGGGIRNGGVLTATSVTIARNSATEGGNVLRYGSDSLTLGNTIVAEAESGAGCSGPAVLSAGHNLDSDGTCGLAGPGDLSNVDAFLAPLRNYGGPTQTHELQSGTSCPCGENLPGSPAIDAGDSAACTVTDQRGIPRPFDGDGDGVALCDIGAHENDHGVGVCACPAITPTPGSGAAPEPSPTAVLPSALPATGGAAGSQTAFPLLVAAATLVTIPLLLAGVSRKG